MSYTISLRDMHRGKIIIVGVGGTGSFVAESVCRLLIGSAIQLVLVDYDKVEPQNIRRQNFLPGDEGKFKSRVLSERLAREYGRKIAYSIMPFDPEMIGERFGGGMYTRLADGLIIGCVDGPEGRRSIGDALKRGFNQAWWLDSGNSHHSGQVLIGNVYSVDSLDESFNKNTHTVTALPMPSLQSPALLAPPTKPDPQPLDCAEAIIVEDQSPVINQAMAMVVNQFVYQLLKGELTNMGTYIDLDAFSLHPVPAEPETVARLCGVKVDTLFKKEAKNTKEGFQHYAQRR